MDQIYLRSGNHYSFQLEVDNLPLMHLEPLQLHMDLIIDFGGSVSGWLYDILYFRAVDWTRAVIQLHILRRRLFYIDFASRNEKC